MLTRKEFSKQYGQIETKFNRIIKVSEQSGLEQGAIDAIKEILHPQQLLQVARLNETPEKIVTDAKY